MVIKQLNGYFIPKFDANNLQIVVYFKVFPSNQEKIRTLREKETYKYLGMLEPNTIKQAETKQKRKKSIPGEREKYMKPNYIAEISSKG